MCRYHSRLLTSCDGQGSVSEDYETADENDFTHPDFEMNAELGEPCFGRAGMEHYMW